MIYLLTLTAAVCLGPACADLYYLRLYRALG